MPPTRPYSLYPHLRHFKSSPGPQVAGLLFVALLALPATPTAAQEEFSIRTPVDSLIIGGRVHTQFNTSSVEAVPSSEFMIRRARLWVATRVNDFLDGVVQLDFAGGSARARYVFLRGWFAPEFRVSAGQFKRSFDMFGLTSSSQILPIERTGRIRGIDTCEGVGSICSYSRFSEALEYSSLDVGVMVEGDLAEGRLFYRAALTNGSGDLSREDNDAKSVSGRLEVRPAGSWILAANFSTHDYGNPVLGTDVHALALSADAQVGNPFQGPRLKAAIMSGDNWLALAPDGSERPFLAWQTVGAYRVPTQGSRFAEAVEAVFRVSYGDPNRDSSDAASEGGWLLTPGINAYLAGRNRVSANIDFWRPTSGPTARGLRIQTSLYF